MLRSDVLQDAQGEVGSNRDLCAVVQLLDSATLEHLQISFANKAEGNWLEVYLALPVSTLEIQLSFIFLSPKPEAVSVCSSLHPFNSL